MDLESSYLKRVRELLPRSLVGYSISLIVIAVGLALFMRSGRYQATLKFNPGLNQGFRSGYVSWYPGQEPMRVTKIQILKPVGSSIAIVSEHPEQGEFAHSLDIETPRGLTDPDGHATVTIFVNTPKLWPEDSGSIVEVLVTATELSNEKHQFQGAATAVIP